MSTRTQSLSISEPKGASDSFPKPASYEDISFEVRASSWKDEVWESPGTAYTADELDRVELNPITTELNAHVIEPPTAHTGHAQPCAF